MRVLILAVGRARAGPERALYEHYAARILWPLELQEIELRPPAAPARRKALEGERLLAAAPAGATLVALDAGGTALTSEAFAERLGRWRDGGVSDLAVLIGGAEGLDAAVLARAELRLSFGRVTWPHLLVRALLAEQLYRAQQILAGHPYHRG